MPKIANPGRRSTDEWIGKTPDSKIPNYVRLRVFDRHGGVCYLTGVKIQTGQAWEIEHVKALHAGGEHRESNFRPALVEPHKAKTAKEKKAKAKVDAVRKAHLGIGESDNPLPASRNSDVKIKVSGKAVAREKPNNTPYANIGPTNLARRFQQAGE